MASIGTTLAIYDQMSAPLEKIRSSLERTVSSFDKMADVANSTFDDTSYREVESSLQELSSSITHAEQTQWGLNHAMEKMGTNDVSDDYNKLNQTMNETENKLRNNNNQQKKFTEEVNKSNNQANRLNSTFLKLAGTIGAAFSVKKIIGLSDEMTNIESRLNLINDKQQTTAELQDMIFRSAQRSRGSYQDMADSLAQLEQRTSGLFASNAETLQFAENLNKQFIIAGTEQQGIAAATLQLNQAMGMGVLRGEEFNSIMEQTPQIIGMIADYMGVSETKMKELASEGEITAEIIKNAMLGATDEINAQFEQMPMTFAQIWQSFQNTALMAFQPVLQRINDIANSTAFQTFVNNAIQWVGILANFVTIAFEQMASLGQWVANNWELISPAVWGIVTALTAYVVIQGAALAVEKLSTAWKAIHAGATWLLKFATDAQARSAAFAAFANMAWNYQLMIVVGIVIAVIAVVYGVVAAINHFAGTSISATGLIAGAFAWLGTFILNIFIAIINTGIIVVNLLINAFQIGVWAIQIAFIGLITLVLLIFDGILNSGIILIELLVNAWNIGIWSIQMLWIGLNVFLRNLLQGILNFGISVAEGFANAWNDAIYGLQMAFYKFQTFVSKVMQAVGQGTLGVVNAVLSGISSLVNSAVSGLNSLIGMANKIPGVNISTIGTVDLQVGKGAQGIIDNIGSGITAPVRAERVSLNRSTVGQDYMDNVSVPSLPQMTSLGRTSLTSDFLGSIEMPKFPKLEQTFDTIDFKDMGKAFDAGYKWGENLEQKVKDFSLKDTLMDWLGMDTPNMDDLIGGGLEDLMDVPGIEEMTGGGLGDKADKATGGSGGANKATGGGLGDKANKATGGSGVANKAAKDLGKIKDNTKDIADDLGITKEDLKYMRDLASRDYVNRYTNNEIILNFDNTNNVNNEMDLDGVVDYVAKGLEQAVEITVEGVYP